ncbi:MAG TPA: tetratricopeptide repeat protein [Candidatus Limnocylindrales bacterium]|nr:tetratricopeptide repeat protein [Candidatus Limnocylindrales bacterium]
MSEALYERYKDALRRGHIAALRGRNEAALGAYREAAALAPERPLPHASAGTVLLRLGRADEAEAAFAVALARSPDDPVALAGRADAFVALGRAADAARILDRLSDVHERAGHVVEACEAGLRALALAESRSRRRLVRDLVDRLREAGPDDAAADVIARAIDVLEPAVSGPAPEGPAAASEATPADAPVESGPPDPLALAAEAEAAASGGDPHRAAGLLRAAIVAHRRLGQPDAALDVAVQALALEPIDPDLHVALAELYLDRGWRPLAVDKLRLLARLAALGADESVRDRLRLVVDERLPDADEVRALLA